MLDFALPPRCPGCGTIVDGDDRFCTACWQSLAFIGDPACAGCGIPLDWAGICEACSEHPPAVDRARAAVAYGGIATTVALRLKYGRRPGLARTMAAAMARLLADAPADALLAPVPLHRWRLWSRGYNQAQLVATALARASDRAVDRDLLRRARATPVLRGLGRDARRAAVHDAFALAPGRTVAGRTVVLVDDVMTTGATADACAHACRAGGAAAVWLVCWARVMPGGDG